MKLRWLFAFFLVSGFCSLVYQVVWLRLAMAAFGVTTPMVSIVLSVFMAGLALGSWGAGWLTRRLPGLSPATLLVLYAVVELVIGLSGIVVPAELRWGRTLLAALGGDGAWASSSHYLAAGIFIALALTPFCTAMGATFPLAMAALRRSAGQDSARSFSYLYLANVLGAAAGTLVSALVLIELFGLRGTLLVAAALNALLAAAVFALSRRVRHEAPAADAGAPAPKPKKSSVAGERHSTSFALWLLFTTGLVSMAMEVVWVRLFTPFLGTVVYGFAAILAVYLTATFVGSLLYRRWAAASADPASGAGGRAATGFLWILAGVLALLPLAGADPRGFTQADLTSAVVRVVFCLGPFCAAMGFVTPLLIDRWSGGDPRRAGTAYALNVLGCILGPLAACFVLLPSIGERWSLVLLACPLVAAGFAIGFGGGRRMLRTRLVALAGLALALVFGTRDFEIIFRRSEVRRDSTATVIAVGEGMRKQLLVNGYGMTILTPVTKMMAHLPGAMRGTSPSNMLVICFGMGTSFRSGLAWGIPVTAVELIPSVPELFGSFHSDAERVLALPGARIVIDDGRRFLERDPALYDVITVDPPPPVEAAGSSLLYSKEYYALVRKRLAPGGILQQWFPGGEATIQASVVRAIQESFPHVRVFNSHHGWGLHMLASMEPIPHASAAELAARVPAAAAADMLEWEPGSTVEGHFQAILAREFPLERLTGVDPRVGALVDDRPVNEYYFLGSLLGWRKRG